jgi:hypothetical protein
VFRFQRALEARETAQVAADALEQEADRRIEEWRILDDDPAHFEAFPMRQAARALRENPEAFMGGNESDVSEPESGWGRFWNSGGENLTLGTAGFLASIATFYFISTLAGPIGPLVVFFAFSAILGFGAGMAEMLVGGFQLAHDLTPEQHEAANRAMSFVRNTKGPAGLSGAVIGGVSGEVETGTEIGGFVDDLTGIVAYGGVPEPPRLQLSEPMRELEHIGEGAGLLSDTYEAGTQVLEWVPETETR